jgi:hypothetical protein
MMCDACGDMLRPGCGNLRVRRSRSVASRVRERQRCREGGERWKEPRAYTRSAQRARKNDHCAIAEQYSSCEAA